MFKIDPDELLARLFERFCERVCKKFVSVGYWLDEFAFEELF